MSFVILKFGGTSVSSLERWQTIAQQARERQAEGLRPVIVCSAVRGVSDDLVAITQTAPRGEYQAAITRIRERHAALCAELQLDLDEVLGEHMAMLDRLALGASLIGEVSPRLHARILSFGELALTQLGTAWLQQQGLNAVRVDARDCLRAVETGLTAQPRRYLGATVHHDHDAALHARLSELDADVVVTQGFIARNSAGETVLLGRGGSDTSAACLAACLGAVRCEIWTDVPGMFTANPRQIPGARLIRRLGYDEAQEIASSGAKVLHPACIAPVRKAGIPLEIRCTPRPELPTTVVGPDDRDQGPMVHAISSRGGLTLVSMETVGMWQQVGFMADVFACFKRHELSVDLVSTSETNVTASLDPAANGDDPAVLDALLKDLSQHCRARLIGPCASISLVGRRIRAILHKLAPALAVFEEQQIHLLSQAASDLNLTFVVDEDQSERLVRDLHQLLFTERRDDSTLGPTWASLFAGKAGQTAQASDPPWWLRRRQELVELATTGPTPLYVYDRTTLERQAAAVSSIAGVDRALYAIKANDNPDVLRLMAQHGLGMECVSRGELEHVRRELPDLPAERILFTPNFAPRDEYAFGLELGVHVTLDSPYPLAAWPELFRGRDVFLRLDPGRGRGHHEHVRTAGNTSKFGIPEAWLDEVVELVDRAGARVVGLHAHAGSGIRTPENWSENALFLARAARRFAHVRVLDLGGGFGVVEHPGDDPLDLDAVGDTLSRFRAAHPDLSLWVEPGRYLVAEAGVLLARVTQTKGKGNQLYVGIDAGMNALIRPALYGAWHEIRNLSRDDEPRSIVANVVGPICESGDTLGYDRRLPECKEGDVLLIATTGAYGRVMSSSYNRRTPPPELVL